MSNSFQQVYYHSGGLRINPNLYTSGDVCLSLLNTWHGSKNEKWTPTISTMLQVLVSMQGMVLNAKPYFNEPGYEASRGSASGENLALEYNQRTLIYSLKTMVYTMKKPPKHFEDLVIGHFRDRASGILTMCRDYYTKGLGVKCGIVVTTETATSQDNKKEVEGYMKTLVGAFKHIGLEDREEFVAEGEAKAENLTLQLQKKKKKKKNLGQKILSCFVI
ncbi:putative ubiquitin-conjugating enzyme E2, ubiquitin-conjugating enzyme/RWD [Helianthus annuus]|nr:putative ubiquitin-conjugating enzyme E2, ubiquitin-conjugating enzyme/RWD [Helianthus annuus]